MQAIDPKVESLIRDLPDAQSARLFLDRISQDQPGLSKRLHSDAGLLSDALALAAWSPLLATTLEQNPEYAPWLMRERGDARVRTCDELKESLARFALTNSTLSPQVLFARFRRRELLRIYLHDIRGTHTIVETTEELSNLADAILDYALTLARQQLDNRFGPPQHHDERGRVATAEFTIMALGKLGSRELNYASDIDLVFLYSDDGMTAGSGDRGAVTNREYFVKLAENVAKLVGQPAGEGAAYRVDLRLRPHGRDGALASSFDEALKYYAKAAQTWELQALIRSRAAAGSSTLFTQFFTAVEQHIYRRDLSVKDALASVRLAKQKIDRHIEQRTAGFNVKLQRGGIREIEFIAQALQLAHGGNDEWLRVSHTLISLGRLADRGLITEVERSQLSAAYAFLRRLEHRLQMEHGLQTHNVPQSEAQRWLVARRTGFAGAYALALFDEALNEHTRNVRQAYDRVFAGADVEETPVETPESDSRRPQRGEEEARLMRLAARIFVSHRANPDASDAEQVSSNLIEVARNTANPHRAAMLTARIAASLEKTTLRGTFADDALMSLVQMCGVSEFFGETVAANPQLIDSLGNTAPRRRDYRAQLRAAIDPEKTFPAELSAFRQEWSRLIIEMGQQDAAGNLSLPESNALQTELAIASINVACLIARRELVRRHGRMTGGPRLSVLALGRLASGGVDYGSDLDVTVVYDPLVSSPIPSLTQDEAYARLCELMVAALSSITREGYLYRVDLRLRPNGKNGPIVVSSEGFLDYLRQHSAMWEWLAYVKLRAVAGDLELGRMIETHARHIVHEKARQADANELRNETRRVRQLLEKEKGKRGRYGSKHGAIDIKYSAGGMLDVYFAVRYLQLRDDVAEEGDDRSTQATLDRLEANNSLSTDDYDALSNGYSLLRAVDHRSRISAGKLASLPSTSHPTMQEIAAQLGYASAEEMKQTLTEHMAEIRRSYDRITG